MEWVNCPLVPVTTMLYVPGRVALAVEIWRMLAAVPPTERLTGFCPPMTVMNPKGTVTLRVTVPVNPLRLVMMMLVVLVDPCTLAIEDEEALRVKSRLDVTWTVRRVEAEMDFLNPTVVPVTTTL